MTARSWASEFSLGGRAREAECALQEACLNRFGTLRPEGPTSTIRNDNGSPYRSEAFREVVEAHGLRHWRTQPYRPQTNGKPEAFVKIVQNGWAYKRPYDSTAERIAALPGFLRYYNGYRPHGGLGGDTPLGRLSASTTS